MLVQFNPGYNLAGGILQAARPGYVFNQVSSEKNQNQILNMAIR